MVEDIVHPVNWSQSSKQGGELFAQYYWTTKMDVKIDFMTCSIRENDKIAHPAG